MSIFIIINLLSIMIILFFLGYLYYRSSKDFAKNYLITRDLRKN